MAIPEKHTTAGNDRRSMADSVLTFDSNLLTPPLSTGVDERPPFIPLDSDNVSLFMKKSDKTAKHRRRLNRACASSGDVDEEQERRKQVEQSLTRKSLPDLKKHMLTFTNPVLSEPGNHAWIDHKLQEFSSKPGRGSCNALSSDSRRIFAVPGRPRRWTVPTKARPTHLVCFTNYTTPTASLDKSPDRPSTVTPAMIVLRRATTKKQRAPSIPETNITFFPPPKFNRTSTTLLSFLRMASQKGQERITCLNTNATMTHSPRKGIVPSPPRRPSVTRECARLCCSVIAEPAVTDVMVHSAREYDPSRQFDAPGHRRFSTKIISDSTVHEIIWDENAISGESNSSSSTVSRQPTTNKKRAVSSWPRQQSIAVEKLETQLRRDSSERRCSFATSPCELQRSHQNSLQSLLNFKFGEAQARNGDLRDLPRSRASLSSVAFQAKDDLHPNARSRMQGPFADVRDDLEFFPTLRRQEPIRSQEHITIHEQRHQLESEAYSRRKSSMGCSIGQSSHIRRKSVAKYYRHMGRVRGMAELTDEHMSLLSQTGLDGFFSYGGGSSQGPASSCPIISVAGADRAHPLNLQRKSSISHIPLRRLCEICEFNCHRKRIGKLDGEVLALEEGVNTLTEGKGKVSNGVDGTGTDGRSDEHVPLTCQTGLHGTRLNLPDTKVKAGWAVRNIRVGSGQEKNATVQGAI